MEVVVPITLVTFLFSLNLGEKKYIEYDLFVKRKWPFGEMLPAITASESWGQFQG